MTKTKSINKPNQLLKIRLAGLIVDLQPLQFDPKCHLQPLKDVLGI